MPRHHRLGLCACACLAASLQHCRTDGDRECVPESSEACGPCGARTCASDGRWDACSQTCGPTSPCSITCADTHYCINIGGSWRWFLYDEIGQGQCASVWGACAAFQYPDGCMVAGNPPSNRGECFAADSSFHFATEDVCSNGTGLVIRQRSEGGCAGKPGLTKISCAKPDAYIGNCAPCLVPSTEFTWDGLKSGAFWDGAAGRLGYEDFAMVFFHAGAGTAHVTVRLFDSTGLDFTYKTDNNQVPLEIDGTSSKKTILLNVANVAFPATDTLYQYHPSLSVRVQSDIPIVAVPPWMFSASGTGTTVSEATENAWRQFGYFVPKYARGDYLYAPYGIFWRNVAAFPGGWDTKVTILNTLSHSTTAELHYYADYLRKYDGATCKEVASTAPLPRSIALGPKELKTVFLREVLGENLDSHVTTEGAFGLRFLGSDAEALQLTVEVVPLPGGTRLVCN